MFQPPLMFTVRKGLALLPSERESRCDERRHECCRDPLQRGRSMRRGWRKNERRACACAKEEGVGPRRTVPRKTGETLEVMLWLGSPLSISLGSF